MAIVQRIVDSPPRLPFAGCGENAISKENGQTTAIKLAKKGEWNRGMTNHTLTFLSFMPMKIAVKVQKIDAKVQ